MRAGKPEAAAEQFKVSLLRQPNRARSLLGAARAAAKAGDQNAAASAYKKLLEQWQQADQELTELREARDYLKKVKLGKRRNFYQQAAEKVLSNNRSSKAIPEITRSNSN
ncbi:MAG: hypothetical protein H0T64_09285 [Pyrinomonadaceae bacterium]|nr:hypothetical protein [Pyrinomonadaceae bacterium]